MTSDSTKNLVEGNTSMRQYRPDLAILKSLFLASFTLKTRPVRSDDQSPREGEKGKEFGGWDGA